MATIELPDALANLLSAQAAQQGLSVAALLADTFEGVPDAQPAGNDTSTQQSPAAVFYDTCDDILLVVEADGRIRDGNLAAARALGCSPETLDAQHCLALIHPDDRSHVANLLANPTPEPTKNLHVRLLHAAQHEHLWEVRRVVSLYGQRYLRLRDLTQADQQDGALAVTHSAWQRAMRWLEQSLAISHMTAFEFDWHTGDYSYTQALDGFTTLFDFDESFDWQAGLLRLHPADRHQLEGLLAHFQNQQALNDTVVEARLRDDHGKFRWVRASLHSETDDQGGIRRLIGTLQDIREQKMLEKKLRENERTYRSVISAMSEGIIVQGRDGELIFSNESAERIMQLANRAASTDDRRAFFEQAIHDQHGNHLPLDEQPSFVTLRTGQPISNVLIQVRHPNESEPWMWLQVNSEPIYRTGEVEPYAAVVTLVDVTEQQRFLDKLQFSERRFSTIFDNAPVGIVLSAQDGEIVGINRMMRMYTGLDENELMQMNIRDLLPNFQNHDWRTPTPGPNHSTAPLRYETTIKTPRTRELPVEVQVGMMIWNKRPVALSFVSDIRDRYAAQQSLEHMRHIELELEQERELNALKSRFVSTVSHEFRTPMSIIQMSAETLLRYDDRLTHEKRVHHLEQIRAQVQHLTVMMNDVSTVNELDSGQVRHSENVDLALLLQAVETRLQDLLEMKMIALEINVHDGCAAVRTDQALVQRILFHLISNAIKYSPTETVVGVQVRCSEHAIRLRVEDHGIGIPEADAKHIFDKFYRARNSTHVPGSGLGLAIVQRAVDLLEGKIEMESHEGRGTVFTVKLPQR